LNSEVWSVGRVKSLKLNIENIKQIKNQLNMENSNNMKNQVSRRKFIGLTAAAAAFSVIPGNYNFGSESLLKKGKKPNSKFGGVQVGAITYSWRSMTPTVEAILQYCLQAGISSIELMGDVAEKYAGLPQIPTRPRGTVVSDEDKAEVKKITEEQHKWRLSGPMQKYKDLRKMYKDAGVDIHIVKFSPENWSDAEIDYSFNAAKALGAKGVCNEISDNACKRMGPFAQKHGMYAIFHQHFQPKDPAWTFDKFLEYSPANMLNFDAGHYFGVTGLHPNGIIERLHNRIASIHLKDKTGPNSNPANTNTPWGKGEMPIADILLLVKKNKWPIYMDIELEYDIPEGSDAAAEVKKCVEYCKAILA
jgi:sugar phosphate isomerase/epimerase